MAAWAGPLFTWPLDDSQLLYHIQDAGPVNATLFPFSYGLPDGAPVGYGELSRVNTISGSASLSRIVISPEKRDRGLGRDMVAKLLEFGFQELGLHRIDLRVFTFNKPAIACYQNLGFVHEGTLRETTRVDGKWWSSHVMSMLRSEWAARKK